jgi:hypothetical protein
MITVQTIANLLLFLFFATIIIIAFQNKMKQKKESEKTTEQQINTVIEKTELSIKPQTVLNSEPLYVKPVSKTEKCVMIFPHQESLPLDGKDPICDHKWWDKRLGPAVQHDCGTYYHIRCLQFYFKNANGRNICFFCEKPLTKSSLREMND